MALKIRSMKDFSAGLMFMGIGGLFAIGANQYPMGTGVRMARHISPGYSAGALWHWASSCLSNLLSSKTTADSHCWRPLIMVIGAVWHSPQLINSGGLITATVVLIIMCALGGHEFKWKEAIIRRCFCR